MFTGIITDVGTIDSIEQRGDLRVRISTSYAMAEVALGASIACSGVCLTVIDKSAPGVPGWFTVDVSHETVSRTATEQWQTGRRLNLERALKVGDELGGHIVTGHVDGVGTIADLRRDGDSLAIAIAAPASLAPFIAAKGSITIDGVSLTVNDVTDQPDGTARFAINLIPHTQAVTTLGTVVQGQGVNLEIDVLARYLQRMEAVRGQR
ncbi:riboflavin synthase [Sphingomonas sp.]|jgi:riboflavin synthase|uniref:riboflavin synthase n=1 Tax=Sphingomonas sp. TaxID=28214 RepID=UPI00307E9D9B